MSRDYRVEPLASQEPIEGLTIGTRVTIGGIRGQDPITGPIKSIQEYPVLARTDDGGLLPVEAGLVYYYIELENIEAPSGLGYAYWKQNMDGGTVRLAEDKGAK